MFQSQNANETKPVATCCMTLLTREFRASSSNLAGTEKIHSAVSVRGAVGKRTPARQARHQRGKTGAESEQFAKEQTPATSFKLRQ
jgi:hypothetical protein